MPKTKPVSQNKPGYRPDAQAKPADQAEAQTQAEPTRTNAEERRHRALIRASQRIEAIRLTLKKIASTLPDPPTVDIALDTERMSVIASSIGALATVEEVQLGAVELGIALSEFLVKVIDEAAHATPQTIAERQSEIKTAVELFMWCKNPKVVK